MEHHVRDARARAGDLREHTQQVVIGLAIASGAMFALHVNSNFFWMFKSLLGLTTQGAPKTLTMATSLGAVVSLPAVVVLGLLL